jgi:hypothetical protein
MNDERRVRPEDDLRAALAPDDTIASLDPARVIAGAHRRRRVRGIAAAGVAAVAVVGVAAGGFLASGGSLGYAPQPAEPGPTAPVPSLAPPATETPSPTALPSLAPTGSQWAGSKTVGTEPVGPATPSTNVVAPTVASCLEEAGVSGTKIPGADAKQRGALDGRLIVVADNDYWVACDNTFRPAPSVREPARLQRPRIQDDDAFAVAGNTVDTAAGQREFYWAAGMLPSGVAAVRYTFADGAVVDAKVSNGFWMMRHVSTAPPSAHSPGNRIRVQLLSPTGGVVNDIRLNWGTQTCAQISHGC